MSDLAERLRQLESPALVFLHDELCDLVAAVEWDDNPTPLQQGALRDLARRMDEEGPVSARVDRPAGKETT
jgi:hypothetical protein